MKKISFFFLFYSLFFLLHARDYFQQEVNYTIRVKLDDVQHNLDAEIEIEYINHSPHELSFIWFHLWPNAYQNNYTPLAKQLIAEGNKEFYYAKKNERGWIEGLDFKVNGQKIKTEPGESIDIIKLLLNVPLKPGEKITISTPFRVHIPLGIFSRLGHIGQQYQITQWYPKPAVYDQYGWHPMPYLNQGEFYSEWGKFDVLITIPENYVVGATGDLVNGEKETAWLNKKAEETKTMEKFSYDTAFPASSSKWKTLHFHQENVHDFAWFADKRYYVLKEEVTLPHSKRKVECRAMFTGREGNLWKEAAKYVADAVYYYSLWNGDYPYNHATAVDGALSAGGGMEYPNITVIGKMYNARTLERVIAHEVGHNWFYGILGSNERDHAWMDEGINSFNEARYMNVKYPKDETQTTTRVKMSRIEVDIDKILGMGDFDENSLFELGYRFNTVRKLDQPCDFPSAEYTQINYGLMVYGKTAMVFEYLRAYLGTELFDKCAQAYFEKWKFKHPYPDDIKKVYEEVSGKNLSWFFDDILKTTKQIDYKICGFNPKISKWGASNSSALIVKVRNKGKINSPFSISTMKDGKIMNTYWFEGFSEINKIQIPIGDFDQLKIDAENKMLDINRQNNTLKTKGLFKQVEPFNLRTFGLLHNTDKTQLFWVPVMGWNNYNKFMLGAAVYNNLLPEKKLEWTLMPMYGFGNKDLAGGASVNYNMHFGRLFQTVRLGVNALRYAYENEPLTNLNFTKIAPELFIELKKKRLNNSLTQTFRARHVNITKETYQFVQTPSETYLGYDSVYTAFNDLTYVITGKQKFSPWNISANLQQGEEFVKTSLTANYQVALKGKRKSVDIRFFAGIFLIRPDDLSGNYFFQTSGAQGNDDYLYDYVYLGRSEIYPFTSYANGNYTKTEKFISHQFAETDGGFKTYTPLGNSREWMATVNIKSSLPGKIPLKLFADAGFFPGESVTNSNFLYDAGIYFPLIPDVMEIYIPLLFSQDIRDGINNIPSDKEGFKKFIDNVRFTFNIHKLNPFELVRNFSL